MGIKIAPIARSKAEVVINMLTMSLTTINEIAAELTAQKKAIGSSYGLRLEQTSGIIAESIAILEGKYTIGGPKNAEDTIK